MIGIIETELNAFIIMENIKKKYPKLNINIYYLKDSIIEGIERLKENSKIIIVPNNCSIKEKYPEISFLSLKELVIDNTYELKDPELIEAIQTGNEEIINKILKTIPQNKIILINQPIILWIKEIIEKKLNQKVISNIDNLLDDLEKKIKEKKINHNQEGKVSVMI